MKEKDKMLAHQLYDPNEEELVYARLQCKTLCQKYNQLPIEEIEERKQLLNQIIANSKKQIAIEPNFWCDYGTYITLGENFYANHGLVILDAGGVRFGDNVFIGPNCAFLTSEHPLNYRQRNQGLEYAYPITVKDNVWIGAGVQVLSGVTIGKNCVIGAGSVVVKDIPDDSLAVGNPCKVIRNFANEDK